MSARSLRVTLMLSLFVMLGGVVCAATTWPRGGGVLLLAGWATAIGALHSLGRAS